MFTTILSCWQLETGGGCQICESSIVLASFNLWTIKSKHSSHLHQYCNDGGGLRQCSYCLTVSSWGCQNAMNISLVLITFSSFLPTLFQFLVLKKNIAYWSTVLYIINFLIYNLLCIADTSLVWYIHGWHWIAKACGCVCGCRQQQSYHAIAIALSLMEAYICWVFQHEQNHTANLAS